MPSRVEVIMRAAALVLFVGLSLDPVHADNPGEDEVAKWGGPELARLEMLVGRWRVTEIHFDAKGEKLATVKGIETTEWILDRHAVRREYNTGPDAAMYRAVGILTWNAAASVYEGIWFDNRSTTGPTRTQGEWRDRDSTMTFTVESLAADGSPVRYEVVEQFVEDKQRIATTYLLDGTRPVKLLEVKYERAPACPSRMRVVDELHRPRKDKRKDD